MNYTTYQTGAHMSPFLPPALAAIFLPLLIVVLCWTIIWKGIAFWYSARNHQRIWFIVFLIVNTLGILEILYILFWRKNKNSVVTTTTTTHVTTATTPTSDISSTSV
jgi:hypothetical protein